MTMNHLLSTFNENPTLRKCLANRNIQTFKRLLPRVNEWSLFLRQNHYNLRNFNVFATDNPHANTSWILLFTERTNSEVFKGKAKT